MKLLDCFSFNWGEKIFVMKKPTSNQISEMQVLGVVKNQPKLGFRQCFFNSFNLKA